MTIPPLQTEAEYEAALDRIWTLWEAEAGTPEDAELEALIQAVTVYEDIHYPISEILSEP